MVSVGAQAAVSPQSVHWYCLLSRNQPESERPRTWIPVWPKPSSSSATASTFSRTPVPPALFPQKHTLISPSTEKTRFFPKPPQHTCFLLTGGLWRCPDLCSADLSLPLGWSATPWRHKNLVKTKTECKKQKKQSLCSWMCVTNVILCSVLAVAPLHTSLEQYGMKLHKQHKVKAVCPVISSIRKLTNTHQTYTMFAFHQWGFSSGSGDRIPVPAETERRVSLPILTSPRDTVSSYSSDELQLLQSNDWWRPLCSYGRGRQVALFCCNFTTVCL